MIFGEYMKKKNIFFGLLIALVLLSSIFSGCVGQKVVPTSSSSSPQTTSTTTETSQTSTTTTETTTTQTGTPLILAGISYNTETIDSVNHISLSIKNHGNGKATNVVVIISEDYYSNFDLVSAIPTIAVNSNRFYIGDMVGGQTVDLNIYLKAKKSGAYSGAIYYTYDELGSNAKIKDLTTRVP